MKLEVSLTEVKDIFNIIQEHPGSIFELLRVNIKEKIGDYLSELMKVELTHFLKK